MTANFHIRSLKKTDADAIQAVALASWRYTYRHIFDDAFITHFVTQNYDPSQTRRLASQLSLGQQCFLVAEQAEEVVGFCHLAVGQEGMQLLRIYLRPFTTRQGIGTALLKEGELFVKNKNYPVYFCYVHRQNKIGQRFYKKNGFVHRSDRDVGDELYMERWIDN